MSRTHYRTIFVSDIHLGTRGCKAEELASFLREHTCDYLYLGGDIIDGWHIQSRLGWYWPPAHNEVIRRILRKSEKEGTQVIYITGNHDDFLREYLTEHELQMGNIRVVNDWIHITADSRRLWVVHGDLYDTVTRYHRWVAFLGSYGYDLLIRVNTLLNKVRRWLGLPYWSLSKAIKYKVKRAVSYMFEFEQAVVHEARRESNQLHVDGVVCGHIHHPEIKEIDGITYYNSGDWVENCSALVEHADGRIEIVYWRDI